MVKLLVACVECVLHEMLRANIICQAIVLGVQVSVKTVVSVSYWAKGWCLDFFIWDGLTTPTDLVRFNWVTLHCSHITIFLPLVAIQNLAPLVIIQFSRQIHEAFPDTTVLGGLIEHQRWVIFHIVGIILTICHHIILVIARSIVSTINLRLLKIIKIKVKLPHNIKQEFLTSWSLTKALISPRYSLSFLWILLPNSSHASN